MDLIPDEPEITNTMTTRKKIRIRINGVPIDCVMEKIERPDDPLPQSRVEQVPTAQVTIHSSTPSQLRVQANTTLAAAAISSAKIEANQLSWDVIKDGGITTNSLGSRHLNVPAPSGRFTSWEKVKEAAAVLRDTKRSPKAQRTSESRTETTGETWSTTEACEYLQCSRSSWHVWMNKREDAPLPVEFGRGRGKENRYLADDVRKFKEALGR